MTKRAKKPAAPIHSVMVHELTHDFTEFLQCVTYADPHLPVIPIKYKFSGSVEPLKQGARTVMQPGTRLQLTALWCTSNSPYGDRGYDLYQYASPLQPLSTTYAMLDALRLEGHAVLEGVWTLESAQAALAHIG